MDNDKYPCAVIFIIFILLGILILFGELLLPTSLLDPTNGQHTGYITAVEKNGFIYKTNRIYFKTNSQSSQEDIYCVINENVIDQAKQYSRENKEVTVDFDNPNIVWPWQCDSSTDAIITSIKEGEQK